METLALSKKRKEDVLAIDTGDRVGRLLLSEILVCKNG